MVLKCSCCKKKILKYKKIGKGRILRCWFDRIIEDFTTKSEDHAICQCGNDIGWIQKDHIKMRQSSFTYTGAFVKK